MGVFLITITYKYFIKQYISRKKLFPTVCSEQLCAHCYKITISSRVTAFSVTLLCRNLNAIKLKIVYI